MLRKILSVFGLTLLALCALTPTLALRVYFIGNSVTDCINYDELQKLVESRGNQQVWARQMIPGAPLEWLIAHPNDGFLSQPYGAPKNAFTNYEWDVISLQPFDRHLEDDLRDSKTYIAMAMGKSPQVQVYTYQRWPRQERGTYQYFWLQKYTGGWDGKEETADYFIKLTNALRKALPDMKPALMVPVGQVLFEMDKKMKAGLVPEFTDITQFYADGIHLNDYGRYLVPLAYYATLYKDTPNGLPVPANVKPEVATIIQQTVWDVVTGTALSGVETKDPLKVTSVSIHDGITGDSYTDMVMASYGKHPYTFDCADGALPNGMTLDPQTGFITGTPAKAGDYTVTIRATDANKQTATKQYRLKVADASKPAITTTKLVPGVCGTCYAVPIKVMGGNGALRWIISVGKLPIGMRLEPLTGLLTGTAGEQGTFTFTVKVSDGKAKPDLTSQNYTLDVAPPADDTLLVKPAAAPMTITGDLATNTWKLDQNVKKNINGVNPNTVSFGVCWDKNNLYVALKVLDTAVVTGDAVQIMIDGRHAREAIYNSDDRVFTITPDGQISEQAGRKNGVHAAARKTADGYTVEFSLLWSSIGINTPDKTTIGLDVSNINVDAGGRKSQSVWFGSDADLKGPSAFANLLMTK